MEIIIYRSRRKTLSVRVTSRGTLEVRAPLRMPQRQIEVFLREKESWIQVHLAKVQQDQSLGKQAPLSSQDVEVLKEKMQRLLVPILDLHAKNMGVSYEKVTVRCQKSRWGSCSARGNLSFNCLLVLAPEAVLEYVVIHELAHRKHMDHSAAFWQTVEKEMPDYRTNLLWLKQHGGGLLARAEEGRMAQ